MRSIALFCALIPLAAVATARSPAPVAATNAERESGFRDLGECRAALEATRKTGEGAAGAPSDQTGSLFNQAQGNTSRCEMSHGEAVIVVYPRGHPASD